MKRTVLAGALSVFLFTSAVFAIPVTVTKICYEAAELGSGRWQYTYEVTNISLTPAIEEFTIWFDFGSFDNLSVDTLDPPAGNWDEIVIQPEPVLNDDGYYDALVLGVGIGIGESVSGFSVSFDWLGSGEPGSQFYEIINPDTFETLDSGWTIPEPATLLLLGISGIVLRRKKN